jgi:hypothetical protein
VLNLATLPSRQLNIRANTSTPLPGSVKFELTGKQIKTVTENGAPFALFGDNSGNYNSWTPVLGSYSLKATAYSAANAGGSAGAPLSLSFSVIDRAGGEADERPEATEAESGLEAGSAARRAVPQQAGAGLVRIAAYPNPTRDGQVQVALSPEWAGALTYSLLSGSGALLRHGQLGEVPPGALTFDFGPQMVQTGLYYLRLAGEKGQLTFKLMKE